ncbi:translation initiation factor IF-2, partial [Candidatus Dojkabacteria bacterium]|nr:translation initiation factor IF-2 [Candidatus Dojkabacteria bacterium]
MSKSTYNLSRPPIIAVMGHVDHGKTTLLDAVRDTNVQEGEAGGITQNTRAHDVVYDGQHMTFIDTPGHEAFSGMRSRGAHVTDIVLLVVAADDGIQPQTIESIKFAKKSKAPIVIAVNKSDLPGVELEKLKSQFAQHDVLVEEYGGDVQMFSVSAIKGDGLDELLEGLLLQAEISELEKKDPEFGHAQVITLESKTDDKLGSVALCLVQAGEIKTGDVLVFESQKITVRAILDEYQEALEVGTVSTPVWIVGLNEVSQTGSIGYAVESEKEAKAVQKAIEQKEEEIAEEEDGEEGEVDDLSILAGLLAQEQKDEDLKKLNVVVRTDSQGTLEVVEHELRSLNTDEVHVNILSSGTGAVTRKDVVTAKNAHGIVIGFQVPIPSDLTPIIQDEKVLVRIYSVIYELIEEVHDAMSGLLEPEEIEEEVATAKVKKVFELTNGDLVAGSVVVE